MIAISFIIAALTTPIAAAPLAKPVEVASKAGFNGLVLISRGDRITVRTAVGRQTPVGGAGPAAFQLDDNWRWASITKQVMATLVMQQVASSKVDLDKPLATYLPAFTGPSAARITVRHLLRHQSGLPNPDDTPATASGVPAYYVPGSATSHSPLTGYCAGTPKSEPSDRWAYNNCDYIVLGALLEAVTGKPWADLVRARIARPLGLASLKASRPIGDTVTGYDEGKREGRIDLAAFAASASLSGTIDDLWRFDRALMTGKLLSDTARATLWDGRPELGSIALGQWVYSIPLPGCAGPVKIVERRGAIGGVEVRNFILPDRDAVIIAFTNRSGFDFGELWQGKGFSHDLVAAAACP